jgi:acyl carrier protein
VALEALRGDKRLVAYVVPRNGCKPILGDLRSYLAEGLPEYMVPAALVLMDHLPLTTSGKVDRRALPRPQFGVDAECVNEPPQGEVEETLAGIWQDLLGVERVGRDANFFELGGHSLLAMQVMVRIRASLAVDVPMRALVELQTLSRLARRVDELREANLLARIEEGDAAVDQLLDQVAAMPESKVQELMQGFGRGGTI